MKSQHICFPYICLPIMFACFLLVGCVYVSKYEPKESPLATWDPSGSTGFNAAGGIGTLDVSENCARFKYANGAFSLLVWPEPTIWNTSTQVIEFVSPVDGGQLELRSGDQIHVGGSNATENMFYINPPDPSCEADDIFVLHSVRIVEE